MEHPEHPNHPNHEHHSVSKMDQPTPMNMLWGLLLSLLTFLLVVICVLSVRMIFDEADVPAPPFDDPSQTDNPPLVDPDKNPPDTSDDPPKDPVDDPSQGDQTPSQSDSFLMKKKTGVTQEIEQLGGESAVGIYSPYAVIVDLSNNLIIAEYQADVRMNPASMTKVMTLLIACEKLEESDYDEYITISEAIVAQMELEEASGIGLRAGEELTVRDLMYLVGMESDGVASMQLAEYVAGSQQAFVDLMNQKCKDIGLISTHFANVTGLYHEEHKSTCREIASIMAAAIANGDVLTYLSEDQYYLRTNVRNQYIHSTYYVGTLNEITLNYYPLPDGAKVTAAKTGWIPEAGRCLVTYVTSITGNRYVVVTAGGLTMATPCADLQYIYTTYANRPIAEQ